MPWREVDILDLRKDFVFRANQPNANMAELCREYGISRKTGYKWLKRYREKGVAGLTDRSRRPNGSPLSVKAETALLAVRLRRLHPTWGPKKIQVLLQDKLEPDEELPSVRTVARVLEKAGEVKRRRKRFPPQSRPTEAPVVEPTKPNAIWTVDFKGWWRTGDGSRCEPLTVRDAFSRYILSIRILPSGSYANVREEFERLFKQHGLPDAILSDNGSPFACTRALRGLTRLSAWWTSMGIEHLRSRPACPQDNGAHERMHGDMRVELEDEAMHTLAEQQAAVDGWRDEYNYIRPHEALGQRRPSELYRPSPRAAYAAVVGGYPEGTALRKVNRNGKFSYEGRARAVGKALHGYYVALKPRKDGLLNVWFYDLLLGQFDPNDDIKVQPIVDTTVTPCHPKPPPQQAPTSDDAQEVATG